MAEGPGRLTAGFGRRFCAKKELHHGSGRSFFSYPAGGGSVGRPAYSLEGEVHAVPAGIVQGNGYTLYLPDGDWYPSDFENWADVGEEWKARIFDAWTAWNNEDVRFWTVRLEGMSMNEAQKELLDNGYAVVGDRMLRQDGDMVYSIELKEAETDTWGIFASYPVDAQEGWGVQIHAIADTFTASETGNF